MRYTRYIVTALLLYLTISSFFEAIKSFDNMNFFYVIMKTLPIALLDVLLIWMYSKGTSIYGTNNKQRSRWFGMSILVLASFLLLVYAFMARMEADKSANRSIILEKELIRIQTKIKLDSLNSNEYKPNDTKVATQ